MQVISSLSSVPLTNEEKMPPLPPHQTALSSTLKHTKFVLFFILFREGVRVGRGRGRERILSRLSMRSTEPDLGLDHMTLSS